MGKGLHSRDIPCTFLPRKAFLPGRLPCYLPILQFQGKKIAQFMMFDYNSNKYEMRKLAGWTAV
jgi:hypothetical protein